MAQAGRRPQPKPGTRANGGKRHGGGRWGSGWLQCSVCQHEARSRIDYLVCNGASMQSVGQQYGLAKQRISHHFKWHVSPRLKQMISAQHLEDFEQMLRNATEANAEAVDICNLLIRGHLQRWTVNLESGGDQLMSLHANKVLAALELRSRITLELQPEARNLTVNNFLMRDAAELTGLLQDHPGAVAELERWYNRRMKDVTPALSEPRFDAEAAE
jgi:hypothetical protein